MWSQGHPEQREGGQEETLREDASFSRGFGLPLDVGSSLRVFGEELLKSSRLLQPFCSHSLLLGGTLILFQRLSNLDRFNLFCVPFAQ